MVDSNQTLARAEELLRRVSPEGRERARRLRERRQKAFVRVVTRMALAAGLVLAAMVAVGLILPIGANGFAVALVALLVAWVGILFFSRTTEATQETLVRTDLAQLPQRTEIWLESQRPALPAPAARLIDDLAIKLEALAPQLATLNPAEPAAIEVRKLIGEELPELVSGYRRVPEGLRREDRNGRSPDKQLVEGLTTVGQELDRMTEQLASGDLDKLATQNRFLELKYRGDDTLD